MNKEIADKWIEALRSGEYEQGIASLQSGGRFCCLGVLCDLAIKEGNDVKRRADIIEKEWDRL
jgi:hypothetical protein